MDELYERLHHGRRSMLDAFLQMSTLARQAGVDGEAISAIHGKFFDGNVEVKSSFRAVVLLAEIWRPPGR
jgi:hypothetical protein